MTDRLTAGSGDEVTLTIAIKTFNEEQKIGSCIESSIRAGEESGVSYEIVVADSLSTDATVEVASRYPVRIVRMCSPADRGCGAGVQLSYQYATGEYIFFVDGDMTIEAGFVRMALAALREDPRLGGVAGILTDTRVRNGIDRIRKKNRLSARAGFANWLNGGGVYKREAIREAGGYAGDRNLLAYEEADLGMRLRAAGWHLLRIEVPAVRHTGHDLDAWTLLARQWRSGRAKAAGVLLRGAVGNSWRWCVVRLLPHPLAVVCYWLTFISIATLVSSDFRGVLLTGLVVLGVVAVAGLLALKRDPRHVVLSVYHWHYIALAVILGFFRQRHNPLMPVDGVVVQELFVSPSEPS